jgi:uncharacterized membrane protein (UPF0127 family)
MRSSAPAELANSSSLRSARGVVVLTRGDGSVICERCVVADRMLPRMKGLLGKRELVAGEGLLIQPAPSIHTFFMRFPIDVVFLAKNGEVMKVAADVGAWRMRSCRRAFAVLELAAGEAERRGITVGDQVDKAEAS